MSSFMKKYSKWLGFGFLLLVFLLKVPDYKGLTESSDSKNIYIVSTVYMPNSYYLEMVIDQFDKENEGWSVLMKDFEGEVVNEKILLALMAGEPNMDILPIDISNFSIYALKGILTDLSQYKRFDDNVREWLDIEPVLSREGKLLCISTYLQPVMWSWNGELAEKLSVPKPLDNWTWSDFFAMAEGARKDITGDGILDTYLFALRGPDYIFDFYMQYAAAHKEYGVQYAQFDTNEFRQLLRQTGELWKGGYIGDYSAIPPLSPDNVLVWDNFVAYAPPGSAVSASYILLPSLESERCQPLQIVIGYGVNEASEVKEMAAEFLRLYSSRQMLSSLSEDGMPLILRDVDKLPNYDSIKSVFNYPPYSFIENYQKALERGVLREYHNELDDVAIDMIWRYFRSEASEDDVVAALERVSRMMAGE